MSADSASGTTSPSTDPINPEANRWLGRDASGKLRVTTPADSTPATSRTAQSAQVQRLAANLGVSAEALASRIPEDTLRRLKYGVIPKVEADGTTSFKHDIGIEHDKRHALLATDRAHDAIPKGDHARGAGTPQPRTSDGKFSK